MNPIEVKVVEAGAKWREAQVAGDVHRAELIEVVRDAYKNGVSQYRIAELLGVTRKTVRAWLSPA